MAKPKVHFHYGHYWDSWPELVNTSHCGLEYVATTIKRKEVTCKRCLKLMKAARTR